MVHILAAANRMIEFSDFYISNLKLQKILYYAYGANLVLNPEEILTEGPQAWHYGPVFPSVYHAFKRYGSGYITIRADIPLMGLHEIMGHVTHGSKLDQILSKVFEVYGKIDDFELVQLTHQKGSPWAKVYEPQKKNKPIPHKIIEDYFREYVVS